ncbi:MAG: phosphomannomutase/phosphoglucomutase [Gammaproteobacteria bacterium]
MKRKKVKAPQPKDEAQQSNKRMSRAGVTLASISGKIYLFVVVMTGLIASALFYFAIVQPEIERSKRYLNLVFSNYAELAESSIIGVSKRLEVIARSPDVIKSFEIATQRNTSEVEATLKNVLPKAIGVRLVPVGTLDVDMNSVPPISNVTLELLRNSGRGKKQPPEVVRVGQPDQYIAVVENVYDANRNLLGYVLAGIEVELINDGLSMIRSIPGYIEFRQEYSGTIHTLGTYGDNKLRVGEPIIIASLDQSLWQMAYWPAPEEDFDAGDEQFIFMGGLVVIFLIVSVFGYAGYRRLNDTLTKDASSLMRLILDNPDGEIKIIPESFKLMIFYDMAHTLQRTAKVRLQRNRDEIEDDKALKSDLPDEMISSEIGLPPDISQKVKASEGAQQAASDMLGDTLPETPDSTSIIPTSIFRAYDIRGVVDDTLTEDGVRWIGQAIGSEAFDKGEQSVIVARDGRNSGARLVEALKQGIMASGRNVIDIGVVPTPLLYFATHYLQSQTGVMVTGSHNPPEYNGLKIVIGGDSLHGEGIMNLYDRIKRRDLLSGEGEESNKDLIADYINNITGDVALAQPMKIVIDAGNGVAGSVAPILFQALGCEVIGLYCDVDGTFPNHHPDPSKPENLEDLRQAVLAEKADVGLAFDGDGDRLGIIDSAGNIIYPDRQMILFSKDVLSRHPGSDIIFDVKCTRHLQRAIKNNNGRPVMWRTGHSLIKAKMKETGALLAGEQSGHIFFKERWYGFDDALYAGARMLEILSNEVESSEHVFGKLPDSIITPELNLDMADDKKFSFVQTLVSEGNFAGGRVTDIDGIRVDYSTGWGLVRASNTTPCLVIRFEAETEQDMTNIQAVFKQQMLRFDSDLKLPF